jgi:excisionase family DNA binding protein
VAGGSARGRLEEVRRAREQARLSLGRDPAQGDSLDSQASRHIPTSRPAPIESHSKPEYVLTLGEAAARLGVSRADLETMIAAGKIEALPTGYTRTIPTRDVERVMAGKLTDH